MVKKKKRVTHLICSICSLIYGISHDGCNREKGRDEKEREFHDDLEVLLSNADALGVGLLYGRVKSRNMAMILAVWNIGGCFENGVENSSVWHKFQFD